MKKAIFSLFCMVLLIIQFINMMINHAIYEQVYDVDTRKNIVTDVGSYTYDAQIIKLLQENNELLKINNKLKVK
ncbi:hypothetical protein GNP80_05515 [Aliivibrio fischeri]|uniref:hypothetical protein n=1 Tax=Aliivibrio fischeri TaxID=668 RepID=UPI0012D94ACC|nr:hypothetical protein [Aliivibrio fischeri]MUK91893.1 hypothetical protein [Aliivibrio fischeri]